jgi:hypothetical protein
MYLQNGLNGGLQASLTGAAYSGAAVPAAAGTTPQGPTTIGQQGFGIVAGGPGVSNWPGWAVLGGGSFALAALAFIWYSLPR